MKILVVCQHYWPEPFQISEVCEQLALKGHDVTALVGIPNYPEGAVPKRYAFGANRIEEHNGVRIVRCEEVPRTHSVLGLARNYLSYAWSASKKIRHLAADYDVVFVYQLTPVLMAEPALQAKRLYRTPIVLYCADFWPDAVRAMLPRPARFIVPLVKLYSRHVYRSCDRILVNSRTYIDGFIQEHGIAKERLQYIPWYGADEYLGMDLRSRATKKTHFMVMGNIGELQDMPSLLRAVNQIKRRNDFVLDIVGTGSMIESCKEYVLKHELEQHVVFHGRHAMEEMPSYYRLSDICILTLNVPDAPWISSTLPSRLQGYMAAGKPVLAAINGSAADVIEESGCGIVVPAGDDAAMARLLVRCLDHPELLAECGELGRRYFREHFTRSRLVDHIEEELAAQRSRSS